MTDNRLLAVALGEEAADSVIVNGRLVNVLTSEVYPADVAIVDSRIAFVGDAKSRTGTSTKVIDAGGHHLVPGLIDGHQHVEHSRASVTMFAHTVVPFGTTSVFTGFDHIYVVAGLEGVREFLDEAKGTALRVFWGAMARTPYTYPESTVGFNFGPKDHEATHRWPECIGVWELVPAFILNRDSDTLESLAIAYRNRMPVYGCIPLASEQREQTADIVAGMVAAGLRVDHEIFTAEEALQKLRLGLYMLIRESPNEHFLKELIQVVTRDRALSGRVAFCTDDVNVGDVLENGHLDRSVRMAIGAGVDPITAIQMATINCAAMYRIDHLVGNIAPGRFADILMVGDLEKFEVNRVIASGRLVAENGRMLDRPSPPVRSSKVLNTIRARPVKPEDLQIRSSHGSQKVRVLAMEMTDDAYVRRRRDATLEVKNGSVLADVGQDVLYVAVVERHGKTTNQPARAFIAGFGLTSGAVAASATVDDCNIIAIGTNHEDMAIAINEVIRVGGGRVVVAKGAVTALMRLPIGGIVADLEPAQIVQEEKKLGAALHELGCELPFPFMYLGVLSTTAIPYYGITDRGLVDCLRHEYVDPVLAPA